MLLRTFVFFSIISVIYAALAQLLLASDPNDNKDGCFVKEFNHTIPFGVSVPSKNSCMSYWCSTNYLVFETCGRVGISSNCVVINTNSDKVHPKCCKPEIKCTENAIEKVEIHDISESS